MLLIYTEKVTNRIRYIFDVIFNKILNVDFEVITDKEQFLASKKPKISYGPVPVRNEIFFRNTDLLYERNINTQELIFSEHKGLITFFEIHDPKSALSFDPFAASFYLVARYEEYLPYVRDEFGRFRADQSMQSEKGILESPIVNHWAAMIAEIIGNRYKSFRLPDKKFQFIPTIDMDSAWMFRSKGVFRNIGGLFNQLKELDFKGMKKRLRVQLGMDQDPYNTYDRQIAVIKKYELQVIYFILFADYARYDRNTPVTNRNFRILIKMLGDYARMGIHSSYASTYYSEYLKREISRLSDVLNKEILLARQHLTRINIPATYRNYLSNGLQKDFTMGYMRNPGFRAGICDPYPFYDLDLDHVTPLVLYPFAYAFNYISNESDVDRIRKAKEILSKVKEVNGTMVMVWESGALGCFDDGRDGIEIFEEIIRFAK